MTAFIRSLIALAYLASAVTAQAGFVINSFWSAAATISFVGCTGDSSNSTTYTFTDHATGTAGTRKTIVGVSGRDGANDFSVASMTVGGAGATEVIETANAGSEVQSAIYIIDNPSGTTATIAVTFSEGITAAGICVWAAYDISSETAHATASEFQTNAASITLSLNVPSGGVAVGSSASQSGDDNPETTTWTGMTERHDAEIEALTSGLVHSGADTTTVGTPLTVASDWTGGGDSTGVSASFR